MDLPTELYFKLWYSTMCEYLKLAPCFDMRYLMVNVCGLWQRVASSPPSFSGCYFRRTQTYCLVCETWQLWLEDRCWDGLSEVRKHTAAGAWLTGWCGVYLNPLNYWIMKVRRWSLSCGAVHTLHALHRCSYRQMHNLCLLESCEHLVLSELSGFFFFFVFRKTKERGVP